MGSNGDPVLKGNGCVWRRPSPCAEGKLRPHRSMRVIQGESPRPPWGQELDLGDSTSSSPLCKDGAREAEVEGGGRGYCLWRSQSLWFHALRGFLI